MTGTGLDGLPNGLAAPARRALASVGITRLDDLTAWQEAEVRSLHGVGLTAINLLNSALSAHGLDFAGPDAESRETQEPK